MKIGQGEGLRANLSIWFYLKAPDVTAVECKAASELRCLGVDAEAWFRLDWQLNLQPVDVIQSVGANEATGTLTLQTPRPTNADYLDNGQVVPAGKAAEVFVTNPTETPGRYEIDLLIEDTSGNKIPYTLRIKYED